MARSRPWWPLAEEAFKPGCAWFDGVLVEPGDSVTVTLKDLDEMGLYEVIVETTEGEP